jgi:hypothetical protein
LVNILFKPNIAVIWLAIKPHVREVSDSNLDLKICYID